MLDDMSRAILGTNEEVLEWQSAYHVFLTHAEIEKRLGIAVIVKIRASVAVLTLPFNLC